MRKRELSKLMSVAGRILLAFLFLFSQSAWAGQDQKTKDKADAAQKASAQQAHVKQTPTANGRAQSEEVRSAAEAQSTAEESSVAEEKPSGDGSHVGIKVHGHWTIEVRNPDGTLVTHREFENSLGSDGGIVLAKCLVKNCFITQWQIAIDGSGGCTPTCVINAVATIIPHGLPNTGLLVLSGNQSFSAATLQRVSTVAVGALDGVPGTSFQVTSTAISPISVVNAQIVQATVVISFS